MNFAGYMNRDNFMLFAKHFIADVNAQRLSVLISEARRFRQAGRRLKKLNEFISERANMFNPDHQPCTGSNLCEICQCFPGR